MIQDDIVVRNLMKQLSIDEYLNRPGITEVMINRPYEVFLEGSEGVVRLENEALSYGKLEAFANALAIYNTKSINHLNPIQSVTLPDGERGHIMMPPSCEDKTMVFSFRKPSKTRFGLHDYLSTNRLQAFEDVGRFKPQTDIEIEGKHYRDISDKMNIPHDVELFDWQLEMLQCKADRELNRYFELAIQHKLNICMVGGTGSGKTTFTKSLADMIPHETRIITIEDTHELDLPHHSNHAHLFYKEHVTAKAVIASCMRLKPDRIFLTELRGNEAWDYLSALNTGHAGGLTSVHANDARSVHYRIAQLAKESETGQTMDFNYILNTVRATIDIVCFFNKTYMTELYFDPVEKHYALSGRN